MKVIRTKAPVTYGDRSKKTGIIAIGISFEWQEQLQRYQATVRDYEVTPAFEPQPGQQLYNYLQIAENKRARTAEQVDAIFDYFAVDIVNGDSFTEKFRNLQVKALLLDTQQNPVYNTTAADWEIVDTETEIAPAE